MTPGQRIKQRLALCAEQVKESPYSHTTAAGWYLDDVPDLLAELSSLRGRVEQAEKALRDEFFRILPDLDYEETGLLGGVSWAWETHPWKALLGITDDECYSALAARAAVSAAGLTEPDAGTGSPRSSNSGGDGPEGNEGRSSGSVSPAVSAAPEEQE